MADHGSDAVRIWLSTLPPERLTALADIFALSLLLDDCVPVDHYAVPTGLATCIVVTDAARMAMERATKRAPNLNPDLVSATSLMCFFHADILFDLDKSDLAAGIELFSRQIIDKKIRFPDRFGRVLYDRYHEHLWAPRATHLDGARVDILLDGTEQGVYQVGRCITGPLGIIFSAHIRYLPSTLSIPLWHCEDRGCNTLHSVDLEARENELFYYGSALRAALSDVSDRTSDWAQPFIDLVSPSEKNGGTPFYDLIPLIGDTILGPEREALLREALKSRSSARSLRDTISARLGRAAAQGNPEQIAARLSSATQLQLLATLTDHDIVELIDSCVLQNFIKVPPSEVRSAHSSAPTTSTRDQSATLSMHGVRSDQSNPIASLSTLIYREYDKAQQLDELAWRCRPQSAGPASAFYHMTSHNPRETVKDLILSSRRITASLSERFSIRVDEASEATLLDRFLWKLGFDLPRFDDKYARVSDATSEFLTLVNAKGPLLSPADREELRRAGANVFAYMELLLEEVISYNVWLLHSDHFGGTRFRYQPQRALAVVPGVLSQAAQGNDRVPAWSPSGRNVFSTLLYYARSAANWMLTLCSGTVSGTERAKSDAPHFAEWEDRHFPFQHVEFWADSDPASLSDFGQRFNAAVTLVEQSRLPEIRNGLDHYRDEQQFPPILAIRECALRIREFIDIVDEQRFIPKTYWIESSTRDVFGMGRDTLLDYRGRPTIIKYPSVMIGQIRPKSQTAMLIPSGNLLDSPNPELVLVLEEPSIYSTYWSNYPLRRSPSNIPSLGVTTSEPPIPISAAELHDTQP